MSKGSIKKNYILNLFYQLLSILTPLVTTPYISRVFGAEAVGEYSYAESIVSYFVLMAVLGTETYAKREISYVQDDVNKRSLIFFNTFILRLVTTATMLIAYFFSACHKALLLVLAVNIVTVACDITWFFQGLEEFGKIVCRNVLLKLINIIFVFLFIKSPEDLIKYAVGMVTLNLISNLMMWLYIPGYIVKVDKSQIRPFRDIKVILSLFIPTIAIQIYTIFDKTMLGLFTESSYENGYYEQAMKVVRMLQLIVTSIATVMAPRIGYYFARSEDDKIREYMIKAYSFVWFIGIPIALGMMGISDNMVPWFFGAGYEKVKLLLKILPVLTIIIGVSNVTGIQYLLPTQRQQILTKTVIAGAIVNFVANLFLIPRLYSVGAAVASVMAEIVISALQLWHIKEELNIRGIFGTGKNYLVAGIMMLLILRIESSCLSASLVHTIIMIATGVAVYFGFLIMMRDEDILNYLRKIKTIISVKYRGK